MNGTSSATRKFNRFELKYLLSREAAGLFAQELQAYLKPDQFGGGNGSYAVSSLYYDSPDYRFYWEKKEGIKFRRKLRIRHYETQAALTPDTEVFVEIKQRLDRVTQKRRAVLRYEDALRLCDERALPACRPWALSVIEEIFSMVWRYNLRPASMVSYLRQAYIGTEFDLGLRITFNTNLRYRPWDLALHSKQIGRLLLPPDWVVMEIKVNERIPYWLTELVGKHNLRLVRISKYCQSLEAAKLVPRSHYTFAWPQGAIVATTRQVPAKEIG